MKINKFLISLFAVGAGVVMTASSVFAATFGISPIRIENENLKPGSSFVYKINLLSGESAQDMRIVAEFKGDSMAAKWISIKDADKLVIPAGEKKIPMFVELSVPKDAKVGKYEGSINLSILPISGLTQSVMLGGRVSVNLQVIDYDVTDYLVNSIHVNPMTEDNNLSLKMVVKNFGNTIVSDVRTDAEVLNYKTGDVIAKGSASALANVVYPHTAKETKLTFPIKSLKEGRYRVNVSSYKNNEVIYQNQLVLTVDSGELNSVVRTAVTVGKEGLKKAAPELDEAAKEVEKSLAPVKGPDVKIKTTVTVKAPLTNQLIGVIIALLVVLVVVTGKIYVLIRKKRR